MSSSPENTESNSRRMATEEIQATEEIHVTIKMDEARKDELIGQLQAFFLEQFDEELSRFRAEQVLDFALGALGPPIYNQAVQDARVFMQRRLEDLDGEVYEPEGV